MNPQTLIRAHQYLYYVLARPVVSDSEYDKLCSAHGIKGGGGSDLASSYTKEEIELATTLSDAALEITADPCDHEWTFHDESFDHAFGTEIVRFWACEKCGATTSKCPTSDSCFAPDHDLD